MDSDEYRIKSYLQFTIHSPLLSHALLQSYCSNETIKALKSSIENRIINQNDIIEGYFYDIPDINLKELNRIKSSSHPIERLLLVLAKISDIPKFNWNPVKAVFQIPNDYTFDTLNKRRKILEFTVHKSIAKKIFRPEKFDEFIFENPPLMLCINMTRINDDVDIGECIEKGWVEFNERMGDFYVKVRYELEFMIFSFEIDNKKKIIVNFARRNNSWCCICPSSQTKHSLKEIIYAKTLTQVYFFYAKCRNDMIANFSKHIINSVFTLLFHSDEIFIGIMKQKQNSEWFMSLKEDFYYHECRRTSKLEEEKHSYPNEASRPCALYIGPDYFSNITDIHYKTSFFIRKIEDVTSIDVVDNILNEIHFRNKGHKPECSICDQIYIKEVREDESLNFIIDLGNFETYKSDQKNDFFNNMIRCMRPNNDESEQIAFKPYILFRIACTNKCSLKLFEDIENITFTNSSESKSYRLSGYLFFPLNTNSLNLKNCIPFIIRSNRKVSAFINTSEKEHKNPHESLDRNNCNGSFLLLYKQQIVSTIKPNSESKGSGTVPLRCENSEEIIYSNIQASIQCLYCLPSFREELANWDTILGTNISDWAKELIKLFKEELNQKEPGKKSYSLTNFITKFIEAQTEKDSYGQKFKLEDPENFIKVLFEKIHTENGNQHKTYCSCPACKNFFIKGLIVSNQKIIENFYIIQKFSNGFFDIKLEGSVLNFYNKNYNQYNLEKVPLCLLVCFKNQEASEEVFRKNVSNYLDKNFDINYKNADGTNHYYKLKAMILQNKKNYKCLIYSRTYNKWWITMKSISEPLLIDFNDYLLRDSKFLPILAIYYKELDEKTIRSQAHNIFIALLPFTLLKDSLNLIDSSKKTLKCFVTSLKVILEKLEQNINVSDLTTEEFFSNNIISELKKRGKITNPREVLFNLLAVFHDNQLSSSVLICECLACKLFCSKIKVINEGSERVKKSIGKSINLERIPKQVSFSTYAFDISVHDLKKLPISQSRVPIIEPNNLAPSAKISILKTPKILVLDLDPNIQTVNLTAFSSNLIRINVQDSNFRIYELTSIIYTNSNHSQFITITKSSNCLNEYNSYTLKKCENLPERDFIPFLGFYKPFPYLYIKSVLKVLCQLKYFTSEINSCYFQDKWFLEFRKLISSPFLLDDPDNVFEFIKLFAECFREELEVKTKIYYDIEKAIKLIFDKIHQISSCNNNCAICKNFLLKGIYNNTLLFMTRLLITLKIGHYLKIEDDKFFFNGKFKPQSLKVETLPNYLVYILEYDISSNDSPDQKKNMWIRFLYDNSCCEMVSCFEVKSEYMLKYVVFMVKNGYEIYEVVENCYNQLSEIRWKYDKMYFENTDKLLAKMKEKYDEILFPGMIFYEKTLR